jgi:hypothetical protein
MRFYNISPTSRVSPWRQLGKALNVGGWSIPLRCSTREYGNRRLKEWHLIERAGANHRQATQLLRSAE